jgi:hypothetical protein
MTQITKLYAGLLANPRSTLSFRDFEALLGAFGFELSRTRGEPSAVYPSEGSPALPGSAGWQGCQALPGSRVP